MSQASGGSANGVPHQEQLPLSRLLLRGFRATDDAILSTLRDAGLKRVGTPHWTLLSRLDQETGRAADLAKEMGITKQAMGQVVKDLVDAGYLKRALDPEDQRAYVLTPTKRGEKLAAAGRKAVEEMEASWEEVIGKRRYQTLRKALADLIEHVEKPPKD